LFGRARELGHARSTVIAIAAELVQGPVDRKSDEAPDCLSTSRVVSGFRRATVEVL
jgi:hypothetical protein